MHAVRSKARQLAWGDSNEESPNYNPFRRMNRTTSSRQIYDIEQNLRPPQTHGSESHFVSAAEFKRSEEAFDNPRRSNTEPTTTDIVQGGRLAPPRRYDNNETEELSSSGDVPFAASQSPAEGAASGTGRSDSLTAGLNGSTRKPRSRFQKLFRRKKHNEETERATSSLSEKTGKRKKKFTVWGQLKVTLFGSWINVLLICAPVGIAIYNIPSVNRIAVFVVNFLAIIPLAGMLSYATEEIALRVGETLGGLLNASFGNAVELIVSILALTNNEILIVKTSLIGSMLSNLLLVLGMCFFFGGVNRLEQYFNVTVAQTASSLLALAVGSLIIPTVFLDWSNTDDIQGAAAIKMRNVTPLSRATAVILLLVYGCYLFFQLKTHSKTYNEPSQKVPKREKSSEPGAVQRGIATLGIGSGAVAAGKANAFFAPPTESPVSKDEADDAEEPNLSVIGAIITLCAATALIGVTAEYMVRSIGALTQTGNISAEFVGLILIPIVGNAAEHATAVTVAIKDKMDLAIGVAVGSSLQIALLVLPFMVVLGWILDKPGMDLVFDGLLITVLFVSVLLVNYLIQDGKSHWLEGVLLMATYIIIAVAAWYYPASPDVVG